MRNVQKRFSAVLLAGTLAVLSAGCGSPQVQPARGDAPAQPTGFLSDYSLLRSDSKEPGYLQYVAPGFNPAQYRKFIVESPEIIINTGDGYQPIDPARLAEMIDYYRTRMATELNRHYQVVDAPGPGVARIRAAVVGAVEVMPALKPRDLIPVSALFKVTRMAVGENPYVLRVSIESEALDSQTGALLGETVDRRESSKTVTKGQGAGPEQLHELIDFWVARFVARLDKANGHAP